MKKLNLRIIFIKRCVPFAFTIVLIIFSSSNTLVESKDLYTTSLLVDTSSNECTTFLPSETVSAIYEDVVLSASDSPEYYQDYGWSIAIDENIVVIGAPIDYIPPMKGSVYIYRYDGSEWIEEQKITYEQGESGDYFGYSVDIQEDILVVSAPFDDNIKGDDAGSIYIYTFDSTSWVLTDIEYAPDGHHGAVFGNSVAIDEERIVVGSPEFWGENEEGPIDDSGSAYVFTFEDTSWECTSILENPHPDTWDMFGCSVDIDGDKIVVGAYGDGGTYFQFYGATYVFQYEETSWVLAARLVPQWYYSLDANFGTSVAIDDHTIVVGTPYYYDTQTNGFVYVYEMPLDGWSWPENEFVYENAVLSSSDGQVFDNFGKSIEINNDIIVIGAPCDYLEEYDGYIGSAYLFEKTAEGWTTMTETMKLLPSSVTLDMSYDEFGTSVAIGNGVVLVGSPRGGELSMGEVLVYGEPYFCPWDVNFDGMVDPVDVGLVKYYYGQDPSIPEYSVYDVNLDGVIDPVDVGLVKYYYGPCPSCS